MRAQLLLPLLIAALPASGQVTNQPSYTPPSDPQALLAAAEPYYNFSDPSLKPWHLKAAYQLYDVDGKPSEQGTFEYWWLSPRVYRSTWSRPAGTHSIWRLPDDTYATIDSGAALTFVEELLPEDLLQPLQSLSGDIQRKPLPRSKTIKVDQTEYPCIISMPELPPSQSRIMAPSALVGNTYCFAPHAPALRFTFTWGVLTTEFNQIAKTQDRYLPLEVDIVGRNQKLLMAHVNTAESLEPTDPALTPPKEARQVDHVALDAWDASEGVVPGHLLKGAPPRYPMEAKQRRIQGTVVLSAVIGTDGTVHDVQVVLSPAKSLSDAALETVSRWDYAPYMKNGKAVEVRTLINVIFQVG